MLGALDFANASASGTRVNNNGGSALVASSHNGVHVRVRIAIRFGQLGVRSRANGVLGLNAQ